MSRRVARLAIGVGMGVAHRLGARPTAFAEPAPTNTPNLLTTHADYQRVMQEEAEARGRPPVLSIRELRAGDGTAAANGNWVACHYVVRLVGDGTIIEDTRRSGLGDRDYGQPCEFQVGDMGSNALRALHATVLDMRVGGLRRVRTALLEPSFGYRKPPLVLVPSDDPRGRNMQRTLQGDWLVDIEVSLASVADEPPASLPMRTALWARDVLMSFAPASGTPGRDAGGGGRAT